MFNKKNLPLAIALAIPLLMIALVAAFIYLPGIGKKPQYNFLYITGNTYLYTYNKGQYFVSGDKLVHNPAPVQNGLQSSVSSTIRAEDQQSHFYIYNVAQNTATELTFEQTQSYRLDPGNTSPDGYRVERGSSGGGIFFGGSYDYNSWYIKGHNRSWRLNLKLTGQDYYNMQFLGWVIN